MTDEVKSNPPKPKDTDLILSVAERLKFFFSDANVRHDRFLRNRLIKPQEGVEKGYVPVEVLLRFNSIKKHTTETGVVVDAAKTLSDMLVLNKNETAIARVEPFTMSRMDGNIPLTLYIKNVPVEQTEGDQKPRTYAASVDHIRSLFAQYGVVTLVKLRFKAEESDAREEQVKSPGKARKTMYAAGSAFVEFEKEEELQRAGADVLTSKEGKAVEPKRKLTIGKNVLEVLTMKEWVDAKKNKAKVEKAKNDAENAAEGSKKRDREEEEEEISNVPSEEFKFEWKPGCVIKLNGLSDSCDRESILAAVAKGLSITTQAAKEQNIYADYSRGQTNGAVRFKEPSDSISELATKLTNGEIEIAGSRVESVGILEGDEEAKYWEEFIAFKNKQLKYRAEERAMKKMRYHR